MKTAENAETNAKPTHNAPTVAMRDSGGSVFSCMRQDPPRRMTCLRIFPGLGFQVSNAKDILNEPFMGNLSFVSKVDSVLEM